MGLLFYIFRVLILLICIIHFQECIDIFEVRNNIYVRHDQRIVNVLKRDHIKSQIFEFDATSFHAKSPQGIGNISSEIIKQHAETFSVTATAQINHNIDYLFKQTCSTNQEQNRHIPDVKTNFNKKGEYLNQYSKKISERTKRMIPIPLGVVVIGGAAFLFYGIIMAVKYEVKLDSLQQQLKESQKDLNVVTMALNNLTKDFLESKYLTNFKFEYNSYLSRYQETVHEFVKILHSGKAVTIESIPEELAKYFPVNDNDHEQKFYYLRLIGCNGTRMFIELTVADSRIIDSLKCHSFSHDHVDVNQRKEKLS